VSYGKFIIHHKSALGYRWKAGGSLGCADLMRKACLCLLSHQSAKEAAKAEAMRAMEARMAARAAQIKAKVRSTGKLYILPIT
jgi:hypothetical protein